MLYPLRYAIAQPPESESDSDFALHLFLFPLQLFSFLCQFPRCLSTLFVCINVYNVQFTWIAEGSIE